MSFLITGDIHLSDNPNDYYRFDLFDFMIDTIKKNKIQHVLILGDLTKAKNKHDAVLVNGVISGICSLADVAEYVTIIKGNHDYVDPAQPYFGFLREFRSNIDFINYPVSRTFVFGKKSYSCLMLPSTRDFDADWRLIKFSEFDYIFAHHTFNGAVSESGAILDAPSSSLPYERQIFKSRKLRRVVSGDIHKPQLIKNRKLLYVGAPYHINYGDNYKPRLIHVDNSGKWVPVYFDTVNKFVLEIEHGQINPLPMRPKSGDMVKVRVHVDHRDLENWDKYKRNIEKLCDKEDWLLGGIEVIQNRHSERNDNDSLNNHGKSDLDRFEDFCNLKDIKLNTTTLNVGRKLLKSYEENET